MFSMFSFTWDRAVLSRYWTLPWAEEDEAAARMIVLKCYKWEMTQELQSATEGIGASPGGSSLGGQCRSATVTGTSTGEDLQVLPSQPFTCCSAFLWLGRCGTLEFKNTSFNSLCVWKSGFVWFFSPSWLGPHRHSFHSLLSSFPERLVQKGFTKQTR